jgi:hypothetical protein
MDQQEIEKSISAAFDSIIMINKLNSGTDLMNKVMTNEQIQNVISKNIEHLKHMMSQDWFKNSLSSAQVKQIEKFTK